MTLTLSKLRALDLLGISFKVCDWSSVIYFTFLFVQSGSKPGELGVVTKCCQCQVVARSSDQRSELDFCFPLLIDQQKPQLENMGPVSIVN